MNDFLVGPIVLTGEDSIRVLNELKNPSDDYISMRNSLFAQNDSKISVRVEGEEIIADIPNLDLSFIDEIQKNTKSVSTTFVNQGKREYVDQILLPKYLVTCEDIEQINIINKDIVENSLYKYEDKSEYSYTEDSYIIFDNDLSGKAA